MTPADLRQWSGAVLYASFTLAVAVVALVLSWRVLATLWADRAAARRRAREYAAAVSAAPLFTHTETSETTTTTSEPPAAPSPLGHRTRHRFRHH